MLVSCGFMHDDSLELTRAAGEVMCVSSHDGNKVLRSLVCFANGCESGMGRGHKIMSFVLARAGSQGNCIGTGMRRSADCRRVAESTWLMSDMVRHIGNVMRDRV